VRRAGVRQQDTAGPIPGTIIREQFFLENAMRPLIGSLLLVVVGCAQQVNVEKTVDVDAGLNSAPIVVDGPKKDQKIKVEFTADNPVDVQVILGKDEDAILRELEKATPKVEALAGEKKAKSGALEATIPAGKDYGVYVTNATKKTSVTVKLKSQ